MKVGRSEAVRPSVKAIPMGHAWGPCDSSRGYSHMYGIPGKPNQSMRIHRRYSSPAAMALYLMVMIIGQFVCAPSLRADVAGGGSTVTAGGLLDYITNEAHLPLEGYCRQGQYMPVTLDPRTFLEVSITGQGIVPVEVEGIGRRDVIPVLVTGQSGEVMFNGQSIGRLRVLAPDEVLLGCAAPLKAEDVPVEQLAGRRAIVVNINLDLGQPWSVVAAWDTLDVLVMDLATYAKIPSSKVDDLLALGIKLAVQSPDPPDDRPWGAMGAWQVLSIDIKGPAGAMVNEDAYLPTYAWEPGLPGSLRLRLMWIGGCVVTGMVLLTSLRPQWQSVIFLGVGNILRALFKPSWLAAICTVVAFGGITLLMAVNLLPRQGVDAGIDSAGGRIVADGQGMQQADGWIYRYSRQGTEAQCKWIGPVTYPQVASSRQWDSQALTLHCDPGGRPDYFSVKLPAGGSIAMMSQSVNKGDVALFSQGTMKDEKELVVTKGDITDFSQVEARSGKKELRPLYSPLATLVPRLYRPMQVVGESPAEGEGERIQWWGQLHIAPANGPSTSGR